MQSKLQKTLIFLGISMLGLMACAAVNQTTSAQKPHRALIERFGSYTSNDIWHDLRHSFELASHTEQKTVSRQIHWLQKHPDYFNRLIKQSEPYLYFVKSEVQKRHMPAEITLLPMLESAYDPFAYSHAGAAGLWQIMPGTGTGFGLKQNWWYDERRDIYASTKAALDYLSYLHRFFDGDWLLAIAAYDSGEGTVQQAVAKNRRRAKPTQFWALSLPRETRAYIPRLLAYVELIKHPKRYQLELPFVVNKPYFERLYVRQQLDLEKVAKMVKMPSKALYQLNPGYNRWVTSPTGKHAIVLPRNKVLAFNEAIKKQSQQHLPTWHRHQVKSGETLGHIALHYHTSVALIKHENNLQTDHLRVGKELLIPVSRKTKQHKKARKQRHVITKRIARLGPKKVIYKARRGERISKIAHLYHVRPNAIRFWNHLDNSRYAPAGKRLIIWTKMSKRQLARLKIRTYKVKKGDTLSGIAHKYHVKVKDLKRWNKALNHKYIHAGQKIEILPS